MSDKVKIRRINNLLDWEQPKLKEISQNYAYANCAPGGDNEFGTCSANGSTASGGSCGTGGNPNS